MKPALALLALFAAAPAPAQEAPCAQAAAVPGFAGWGSPAGDTLAVGRRATLALRPAADVRFAPPPARAPQPGSYSGAFPLTVTAAGTYRIAVSDKAWIDVVRAGSRLDPVAHAHGPACSGIAKIVAFRLEAGRYTLQLSEAAKPAIGVMVAKD